MITADQFNQMATDHLPGHLGMRITQISGREVRAELPVAQHLMAPNGYMHAGGLVTLADTAAGCGCRANLPAGASGFTTVELKSNFLGTARDGMLDAVATLVHAGRTTQVWDATVTHRETGRTLALFRCTQLVIYPRAEATAA